MSYDWVHGLLELWAEWYLRVEEYTGHSRESLISRMLRIGHLEPSPGADRVLCLDPPAGYWVMDRAVRSLSDALQTAIGARYLMEVKEDGSRYNNQDRARVLGLSKDQFVHCVMDAKRGIARCYGKQSHKVDLKRQRA